MAALQRAVALVEMDGIAMAVGDTAFRCGAERRLFFDEQRAIAEWNSSFALRAFQRVSK